MTNIGESPDSKDSGDLRSKLNELKQRSSKDQASDSRTSSSYHRTKQVHDYEPYHKSSVTPTGSSSYPQHRSGSSNQRRDGKQSYPDKERGTSSYKSTHPPAQEVAKRDSAEPRSKTRAKERIIKDAEVTEIFSEEEDRSSESENESAQSKRKSADGSRSGSESPGSGKSNRTKDRSRSQSVASNDDLAGDDLQSREARLKAKLKEKFLKEQLDKKYKDSESKMSVDTKKTGSRSSSASAGSNKDIDSNDEGASPRSSKRTRHTENSDRSDGTEKFDSNNESNRTDDESIGSGSDTKKATNGHKKQRRSNESQADDTELIDDYESEDESYGVDSKHRETKKSPDLTKALDTTEMSGVEESTAISGAAREEPKEILPPPPPIFYYCATQGCRSVEEFECLNKIEEGAYGVVYRAKDKKSNEVVALKRLKMEKEREGFPITSIREVDTLLKSQHINVVTVREIVVGSNMDKIYMVMDFVEHDLKSLMQHSMRKNFQMSEVKCLMKQMLAGIAHLHDNWIIHRDLKTSNLLLSHNGIMKIADFGLAREYGSPLREYTPVVVTLWYRCPELLLGVKKYSTAVDMWSVGTIFGELMLLKALFPGKNEKDQLDKIFKDLGTPNEKIWPGWKDLPLTNKMNFPEFPYNTLRSRFGSYLSDNGFELINKLLTYDPSRRISAEDALNHVFFKESPYPIDPTLFPTWPAKSEGPSKTKKVADSEPRAPSAGKLLDDNSFVLQFPPVSAGFTLR